MSATSDESQAQAYSHVVRSKERSRETVQVRFVSSWLCWLDRSWRTGWWSWSNSNK